MVRSACGSFMASRSLPSATTMSGSTPPNLSWMCACETLYGESDHTSGEADVGSPTMSPCIMNAPMTARMSQKASVNRLPNADRL